MRAIGTILGVHTNPLRAELNPRLGLGGCPLGKKANHASSGVACEGGSWRPSFLSQTSKPRYLYLAMAKHAGNRGQDLVSSALQTLDNPPKNPSKWVSITLPGWSGIKNHHGST
jgi:hypothetical protein